jgi:hypothetical protein
MHKTVNSFWGGMLEGLRVEDNRFCFCMSFREYFSMLSLQAPQARIGAQGRGGLAWGASQDSWLVVALACLSRRLA